MLSVANMQLFIGHTEDSFKHIHRLIKRSENIYFLLFMQMIEKKN